MARYIILGSAFAIANASQDNSHLYIESKTRKILIDCGNNPVGKLEKAGVRIEEITDLVLTHAHADHIGALPLLLMDMWLRKRELSLNVFGLPYTLERAKMLLDVFKWQNWGDLFPVTFHEVNAPSSLLTLIDEEDLRISVSEVQHSIPNIGIRADMKEIGQSIVYSSDTKPCANLDMLASNADVLIQESAGPGNWHSSPEQAGKTASTAKVKRLILIHYDAGRPGNELIKEAKRDYFGSVELAADMMLVV